MSERVSVDVCRCPVHGHPAHDPSAEIVEQLLGIPVVLSTSVVHPMLVATRPQDWAPRARCVLWFGSSS